MLRLYMHFLMFISAKKKKQPCGVKQNGGGGAGGEKYYTAIVSADLDRTDNRVHRPDVLKGFYWFTYRAVRWATSKWNL